MNDRKVILLTGASSGIGHEAAMELLAQGHIVYAAARRVEKMEDLAAAGAHVLSLDVTDSSSISGVVNAVLSQQDRIDVLINNAGYGYLGALEGVSMEEARRQLDVNVFGLAEMTKQVLPYMRERRSGRIINISSVAGKVGIAFVGWYNVSKFAVESYSDVLRKEVRQFGIDVVLIEPSGIKTDWGIIAADNLARSNAGTVYEQSALRFSGIMRKAYTSNLLSGPETVAKDICRAVNAKHPKLRYHPGLGAGTMLFLNAITPARWWDAINGKMFKNG